MRDVLDVRQVALLVLPQQVAGVAQSPLGGRQQVRVRLELGQSALQLIAHLQAARASRRRDWLVGWLVGVEFNAPLDTL